jgi:tRNA1(Val) A37 N6-methylase TrmN6
MSYISFVNTENKDFDVCESTNSLLQTGLNIIQRNDHFNFSIDSMLVSEFATVLKSTESILDLGCGNGAIPLFLSTKTKAHITGIEILESSSNLAMKNIKLNNLENQIDIINDDMKNWSNYFKEKSFDLIVSNPPFFKCNTVNNSFSDKEKFTVARHEISITLEDIIKIASSLIKDKGYFTLVHRVDRFVEIIDTMRKYRIEPKKVRFCHTKIEKNARILLIEGVKFGFPHLKMLPPLIINDGVGRYSDEILKMLK